MPRRPQNQCTISTSERQEQFVHYQECKCRGRLFPLLGRYAREKERPQSRMDHLPSGQSGIPLFANSPTCRRKLSVQGTLGPRSPAIPIFCLGISLPAQELHVATTKMCAARDSSWPSNLARCAITTTRNVDTSRPVSGSVFGRKQQPTLPDNAPYFFGRPPLARPHGPPCPTCQ